MSSNHQQKRDPDSQAAPSLINDFDQIVRENQAWLRGYFRSRLQDKASADDLAQDVFVTAYLKSQSFKGESTIQTWLRGIAHNHLRNFIRKHREKAVGGTTEIQAMLEQSCDQWEETRPIDPKLDALANCISQLPEPSKKLLEHRYVLGKSVREISKETGKGYSGLTMQFHRLRELLGKCIERDSQQIKNDA